MTSPPETPAKPDPPRYWFPAKRYGWGWGPPSTWQGCCGVICGNIQVPATRTIAGVEYYNCGDRVDHCTAVFEHVDSRMEMVGFKDMAERRSAIGHHAA